MSLEQRRAAADAIASRLVLALDNGPEEAWEVLREVVDDRRLTADVLVALACWARPYLGADEVVGRAANALDALARLRDEESEPPDDPV